jgi:hypothetical protein
MMKGVNSCLPGRYPTTIELEACTWMELTSDNDWNPNSINFVEQEWIAEGGQ